MKILVISPTPTLPMTAGNRARIHATIGALEQAGHEVHLAHIEREAGDLEAMRRAYGERFHPIRYKRPPKTKGLGRRCVRWAGRRFRIDSWYVWGIDDWYDVGCNAHLQALHRQHRFNAVMVEYVFMSQALLSFPDTVFKIIDTHDVMSHRYRLFARVGKNPRWFSTTPRQEGEGLDRAHLVLAIQDQERQFLQTLTQATVITFGHVTPIDNRYVRRRSQNGVTLLFVGSENAINIDGVRHFLERIYPCIKAGLPSVKLLVAGRICEHVADAPNVRKLGRLDCILDAYDMADIVINPVQYGTGLNIKTIEALGYGMPVVSTTAGARGLELATGQQALVVAADDEDFGKRVLEVFAAPTVALKLSANALRFAEHWNQLQIDMLLHHLEQPKQARREWAKG